MQTVMTLGTAALLAFTSHRWLGSSVCSRHRAGQAQHSKRQLNQSARADEKIERPPSSALRRVL